MISYTKTKTYVVALIYAFSLAIFSCAKKKDVVADRDVTPGIDGALYAITDQGRYIKIYRE